MDSSLQIRCFSQFQLPKLPKFQLILTVGPISTASFLQGTAMPPFQSQYSSVAVAVTKTVITAIAATLICKYTTLVNERSVNLQS